MNSKIVDKGIRGVIRPLLKSVGFTTSRGRTSWRSFPAGFHLINFQSFNSYLAQGIGCTTFSFGVTLGVSYACMTETPWWVPPKVSRPKEAQCQARRHLTKRLVQHELDRDDVWFVRADGSNLDEVLRDARDQLETQASAWFEAFSDVAAILRVLRSKEETAHERGYMLETLGGRPGSFARAEIISALALSLGDMQLAKDAWQEVIDNPSYQKSPEFIEMARSRIALLS